MTELHPTVRASLHSVYRVFHSQRPDIPLFASRCEKCGKCAIGQVLATVCRTCEQPPKSIEIVTENDLDNL